MEQNDKQKSDVLLNTFLINKSKYRVLLHYDTLVWEKENSTNCKTTVPVSDILAIKIYRNSNTRSADNNNTPGESSDTVSSGSKQFITIYYARRVENSRTDYNKWRKHNLTLYNTEYRIIKQWYDSLTALLNDQKRPKNILMFINPYGGRKKALDVYEKHAKPLLQLVGIEVSCVISQRANQIRDIIMTQSLDAYDAVVCVGGDGTFSEVFNGLIYRTIKDLNMDPLKPEYIPKPKLPIGVIPAGSTDTVAYCLHGTTDIKTAVMHIILGQVKGLDLSSVCNGNGLIKLFASVMSYGYLGDVAYDSEKFRWMGPKRYEYSGFKKIVANRGYEVELMIMSNQPNSMIKCTVNCSHCETSAETPDPNNTMDYTMTLPHFQSPPDDTTRNWKLVKGKFFMVSGANISCACSRSPSGFAPYCHLGDGYFDIILIRHTSLFNNIRLLLRLKKKESKINNLPFVEVYRTNKFFTRTPKSSTSDQQSISGSCQPISISDTNRISQWNCDGEIIHDSDILVSSHRQLIDVFMRGPNPMPETTKTTCCGLC